MAELIATNVDILISFFAASFLIVLWIKDNKKIIYLVGGLGLIIVAIYRSISAFATYDDHIADAQKDSKTTQILQASIVKKLSTAVSLKSDTNLVIDGLLRIELNKDDVFVYDTLNNHSLAVIQNMNDGIFCNTSILKIPNSSSSELTQQVKETEDILTARHPDAKFELDNSFEKIGDENMVKYFSLTSQNAQITTGYMVYFKVKSNLIVITYTYPIASKEKIFEITKERRQKLKVL